MSQSPQCPKVYAALSDALTGRPSRRTLHARVARLGQAGFLSEPRQGSGSWRNFTARDITVIWCEDLLMSENVMTREFIDKALTAVRDRGWITRPMVITRNGAGLTTSIGARPFMLDSFVNKSIRDGLITAE